MIECPECDGKMSSLAASCPRCGAPQINGRVCPWCGKSGYLIPFGDYLKCRCGGMVNSDGSKWNPFRNWATDCD